MNLVTPALIYLDTASEQVLEHGQESVTPACILITNDSASAVDVELTTAADVTWDGSTSGQVGDPDAAAGTYTLDSDDAPGDGFSPWLWHQLISNSEEFQVEKCRGAVLHVGGGGDLSSATAGGTLYGFPLLKARLLANTQRELGFPKGTLPWPGGLYTKTLPAGVTIQIYRQQA